MGAIVKLNFAVDDIPKKFRKKAKNGKTYVDVTLSINDEARFEGNVSLFCQENKDDNKEYLSGNGRVIWVSNDGIVTYRDAEDGNDSQNHSDSDFEPQEDDFPF